MATTMVTGRVCQAMLNPHTRHPAKTCRARISWRDGPQFSMRGVSRSRPAMCASKKTKSETVSSQHSVISARGKAREGRKVALSPFDVALQFIPLDNTVFFLLPGDVSSTQLQAALETALDVYPEFGGKLIKDEQDQKLFIDTSSPCVDIFEITVDKMPDTCLKTSKQTSQLKSVLQECELAVPPSGPDSCGTLDSTQALTKVTLVHTKDRQQTGLGFSYNHIVTDAGGMFRFLGGVASLCRGDGDNNECTINVIPPPSNLMEKRKPLIWEDAKSSLPPELVADCGFGIDAIRGDPPKCVWRMLEVPAERLCGLKEELESLEMFSNRFVSNNDIICASLWQLRARLAGSEDVDKELHLSMAYNFRGKRYPSDMPAVGVNYFGNAVIPLVIPNSKPMQTTVGSIQNASLEELVHRVRMRLEEFTPEHVREATIYLSQCMYSTPNLGLGAFLKGAITPHFELYGVHTSNWSRYMDMAALNFGTGPCTGLVLASEPRVPMAIIFAHPRDHGTFIVQAAIPENQADRLQAALEGTVFNCL
uniref:Uncharacterized protein n=1 Tax=Pyramimonas obovata TaxID=1411642 RepID=A0A7S0QZY5_9CHLO|mmetsp:Transcript_20937/g.45916  ORF Transcript_20937/g.45916 Transcript_20937/m.45916 type:complete len:536 (+) Transcript_20937:58-1665(+)